MTSMDQNQQRDHVEEMAQDADMRAEQEAEHAASLIGEHVTLIPGATCHGVNLSEIQTVRRDPLNGRPARVIDVQEVRNDERGKFWRVTLEWIGTDVSGNFAERRRAFAMASDCRIVD